MIKSRPGSRTSVPAAITLLPAALFFIALLAGILCAQPQDGQWWDGFGRAGTTGTIGAVTVYNGDIIAAGNFGYAGNTTASQVAKWNGSEWEPLGEGLGCPVHALAVYGGELYAGGECEDFGWPEDPCYNCMHRWNGASWEPVGIAGTFGPFWSLIYSVNALEVYNGKLYAGGYFWEEGGNPGHYLLQWDGEAWTATEFSLNGPVNSMTVFDGSLIIGGKFTRVDTSTVNRIVAWDGDLWTTLGTGMDSQDTGDSIAVYALHVHDGKLVAGGNFTEAGGVSVDRLASWDGAAWSSMEFRAGEVSDPRGPRVTALTTYDGDLIAGGIFEKAGGAPGDFVASWDDTQWGSLGSRMDGQVRALISHEGDLYAGGDFRFADEVPVYHIGRWDGTSWLSLGPEGMGLSGWVRALSGYEGQIFAGGEFDIAGRARTNHVASWNGAEWDSIGRGFVHPVREVAVYEGRLHGVSEPFRWVGSKTIKWWDGVAWEPFEVEFPNAVNVIEDYDGKMLVGGHDIAFWTGTSWDSFGRAKKGHFRDFVVFDGELVAGGYFPAILVGDDEIAAKSVAAWREGVWHGLGEGMEGPHGWHEAQVHDLLIYRGDLIAAGIFRRSGDTQLRHVAVWNGSYWASVGTGVNGRVYALATYNETVIAAGEFTEAGGREANRIARWNGSEWSPLGAGVDSTVSCLWVQDGYLYVGGMFKLAGGIGSYYVARWEDNFPGMVLSFNAASSDTAILLEWRNPSTEVFEGTLIRFSMTDYPEGPEDGEPLPNGNEGRFTGSAGADTSFEQNMLPSVGTYYYTAFAYDRDLNYSTAAHASAVVHDISGPELSLAVMQNPYLSQYLDVYLIASEPIDSASVELLVDKEVTEVRSVGGSEAVWLGDYKLSPASDSVMLHGCAADKARNETCVTSEFRAYLTKGDGCKEVVSTDRRLRLVIDQGGLAPGTYALIMPCRDTEDRAAASLPEGLTLLADHAAVPDGYRIGPAGLLQNCEAHLEYGYGAGDLAHDRTADQLYIEQDGVGRLDCYVDKQRRLVSARVGSGGTFWLRHGESGSSQMLDPAFLQVGPCRPNPFSTKVTMTFEIRAPQSVRASVFDVRGRRVVELLDAAMPPGKLGLEWDGRTSQGGRAPSGVYFLKIQTDHKQTSRKLALIR